MMKSIINWIKNVIGGTLNSDYYENAGEDVRPYTINEEWTAACDAVVENDDD